MDQPRHASEVDRCSVCGKPTAIPTVCSDCRDPDAPTGSTSIVDPPYSGNEEKA